jgi:hypothetical protein
MADAEINREMARLMASIRETREKHLAELLVNYTNVRAAVAKVVAAGENLTLFRASVIESMGSEPADEPLRRCYLAAIDDEIAGKPPRQWASMGWLIAELRHDPIDEGNFNDR